ncbi:YajG family lipoprotein [Actinoplanes awajinensis]|uniref:DUF4352 domain-containing protein n=1 Tax=Actinoplanes awajinensis subsp. mycoplanecinus TaxID=135947 RepID=A0A101J8N2_9ACTN|nr:hypothetical protein [Actinoplanes awajinensis]KUL22275.1 hypothetical protein ADL15_49085 [Actinoplanes awajinensis subsp. mycoplanecinus]
MRIVLAGLLTVTTLTGCGSHPPSVRASPVAARPPTASPADHAGAGSPAVLLLGTGQDIRTPGLAARVTVTGSPATASAYAVRVSVHVLRGTWEFGPALIRLRYTAQPGGSPVDTAPIEGGAIPPAMTLHPGTALSWRIPFEHAPGAGAQLLLTDPTGTTLAAWTTR